MLNPRAACRRHWSFHWERYSQYISCILQYMQDTEGIQGESRVSRTLKSSILCVGSRLILKQLCLQEDPLQEYMSAVIPCTDSMWLRLCSNQSLSPSDLLHCSLACFCWCTTGWESKDTTFRTCPENDDIASYIVYKLFCACTHSSMGR
jgi:hypothetical protein